jgi:hypothetical protein
MGLWDQEEEEEMFTNACNSQCPSVQQILSEIVLAEKCTKGSSWGYDQGKNITFSCFES